MRWIVAGVLFLVAAGVSLADLDPARAEPNLEKRSKLALDNAVAALKEAREAYNAGDTQKVTAKAAEVQESAELAFASLEKTGKDPRKSPKWFKRAEIESRDLLRSIETLEHDMSFDDRVILEKAKEKVQQVHDDLLKGLMEGKRK
jgi:multidrug resistance efflux pump